MSKKKETYDSICRKINSLLERQEQEKRRMMRVMADVLLTDRVASKIGDFSDTELKKTMRLLSGYMENCIAQVIAERKSPGTQAEVPDRNFQ